MKHSSTGRISRRPKIMSQLKSRHNESEIWLKLVDGFRVVPIAGPMFERQDMVAVTESPRSRPKIEAITEDTARRAM